MGSGVDSEPRRELRDRPTDPDHPETTAAAERQWRRDPAAWGIVLIGLAVLGAFALWVSRFDSAQMTHRLTSIATVPGSLLSVGLAFRASRSGRLDPQTRRAWFVIGVAFTSYFAGALLDYIAGSLAGTGVLPDLTTVLEVGAYPIAAWGVTMLPKARQARSDPILFGLDVAIVAWAAAMLVWHFVVAPVAVESGADLLATAAAAMYPALDLAFLFATLAVVLRGVRPSSAAALLAIGVALLLLFGADLISASSHCETPVTRVAPRPSSTPLRRSCWRWPRTCSGGRSARGHDSTAWSDPHIRSCGCHTSPSQWLSWLRRSATGISLTCFASTCPQPAS
jgi:hypothetical protein